MKAILAILIASCTLMCIEAASTNMVERIECLIQARIYENRLKEILEKLRNDLKEGIPEKNIPPLDPLQLDNITLIVRESFAKLNWTMSGDITGLMNWNVTDIAFSFAGFKFSFEVQVPEIVGKGTYDIDGTILQLLPVYGGGDFDVLANDIVIKGAGKIGSRGSGENQTLYLDHFSVNSTLKEFRFAVTGLMDDEQLSFLISQMISESLPDLIENFQYQINQVVSSKITTVANKVLVNMTLKDIIDMLKPKPSESRVLGIHCGDY